MKHLTIVADWADGSSLESLEVKTAVRGFSQKPHDVQIDLVQSSPSPIHTGFLLAQTVETTEEFGIPSESVIFQSTDHRSFSQVSVDGGAKPLILRLKSGLYVLGPNAASNLSFIIDKIEEVYEYRVIPDEDQFLSRRFYARLCAYLMDYLVDELDLDEVSASIIPPVSGAYIGHIDMFGNMVTTVTHEYLKGKKEYGEYVKVTIDGETKHARYVSHMFGGAVNELVIFPGACGPKENRYLQLAVWNHYDQQVMSAANMFGLPKPGASIEL